MIITQILERNARLYGDDTALIEREPERAGRRRITWAEFDRQADAVAAGLLKMGVGRNDRVAQLMMNCLEWLPIYFGILKAGAWAAPMNFRFSASDIAACARIAEPRAMIFGPEFVERLGRIKPDLDSAVTTWIFVGPEKDRPEWAMPLADLMATGGGARPDADISLMDPAGLYFTSGTTGKPKAVLLTHRNLEFACYVENRHHLQSRSDNFLCIPPLYHTGAKMHWFGNLMVGAPAVILRGVKPEWILEAISQEAVTVVWLLVPWAHDILIAIESGRIDLNDYRLAQWRLMHIGAQPVPPSLIRKWKQVFPHHQYDTNYGLTEATGPGCVHLGMESLHKVGAIGTPGFDWECRVVDTDLKPVQNETPGELAVRGPGVMREYYKDPEATAAAIVDGWLLTGDVARADADGFIWLVDRKKDVIITGGENIYPVEIEDFIMEHEDAQDVAVIGLPDERLGEIVSAVIQLKPGRSVSTEEMLEFCKGLPRYKRPRRIFFDEVPRNPTGKIEKPTLRKRYREAGLN